MNQENAETRREKTALFVTSKDLTTKDRHVIFLHYNKEAKSELRYLDQTYKLGSVVTFRNGMDDWWYATTKTFAPTRAEKIYRASKAANKMTFLKFHRSYLPWQLVFLGLYRWSDCETPPYSKEHLSHYRRLASMEAPFPKLEFSNVRYKEKL